MDFRPNQDQLELQQGIRSFCDDRISIDLLREAESTEGFNEAVWRDLAALGVFQVGLSEKMGGLGLGRADLALVFEELGRCLAPGPLIFTELAAGQLAGAETGGCVVGGVDLRGSKPGPVLVSHWSSLDHLITLRDEGVYVLEVAGLKAERIKNPMDPLTPIHQVENLPLGDALGDASLADLLGLRGRALAAAFALGISEATLDLALAYAKEREQFDRPIASFQSIKHMLADMFARLELARAAVYAAGATLDFPEVGHPERAVCAASICAAESAMKNARACIQVHGGMGYTWEVAAHYYLKRCWVLESMFGSVDGWSDRIAEMLDVDAMGPGHS
jgi:alkylation response protein AidB-like acyl-CoA dehydrogenase